MKKISHRVGNNGDSLGIAVDDDWEQEAVDKVRPDILQFSLKPPSSAARHGPNTLAVYQGTECQVFEVDEFFLQQDPEHKAVIRHYHLGEQTA